MPADAKHAETWAKITGRPPEDYVTVEKRPAEYRDGDVCALGALGRVRGLDMSTLDPDNPERVGDVFDIASPLAREIVYINDEGGTYKETPEQRWARVREWVAAQIKQDR